MSPGEDRSTSVAASPLPGIIGLGFHRAYRCRHAGACCASGWTIPIEVPILRRLIAAQATGGLRARSCDAEALLAFPEPGEEYGGLLGTDDAGQCWFLGSSDEAPGRCAIQRCLGHDALPHACQQFPRVAVLRPTSIAVSLSHYCPSAAALLLEGEDVALADVSAAGSGRGPLEGLDMRAALPPLLRPDALFTWTAFDLWERFVLEALADRSKSLDSAVALLALAAEGSRRWTADRGDFDGYLAATLEESGRGGTAAAAPASPAAVRSRCAIVHAAVPHGLASVEPLEAPVQPLAPFDPVVRRYLISRAWASWVAHEGSGIRGYVRWLLTVMAVLQVEMSCRADLADAIRHADLLLVHLASPRILARTLGRREHVPLWDDLGIAAAGER